MNPDSPPEKRLVQDGYLPVENGELYYREIGLGQPIILLHGGPDFDHNYFLPEMDRLSDSFHLIYYDQRGRGRSGSNVQPEGVSIESEVEDLEGIRKFFKLESAAILGHSWGGLLAMEYSVRYPNRVSHLVLMNTAPPSHNDYLLLRQGLLHKRAPGEIEKMTALASSARYISGDLAADAEYYRIHFRATVRQPEQLEQVVKRLRMGLTPKDICRSRAIEDRLYAETWSLGDYNLFPRLARLHIPTLIIHGDGDLVPVECAAHIAQTVPGARLVVLKDTGHFSFVENPGAVSKEIGNFLTGGFLNGSDPPASSGNHTIPVIRFAR